MKKGEGFRGFIEEYAALGLCVILEGIRLMNEWSSFWLIEFSDVTLIKLQGKKWLVCFTLDNRFFYTSTRIEMNGDNGYFSLKVGDFLCVILGGIRFRNVWLFCTDIEFGTPFFDTTLIRLLEQK